MPLSGGGEGDVGIGIMGGIGLAGYSSWVNFVVDYRVNVCAVVGWLNIRHGQHVVAWLNIRHGQHVVGWLNIRHG